MLCDAARLSHSQTHSRAPCIRTANKHMQRSASPPEVPCLRLCVRACPGVSWCNAATQTGHEPPKNRAEQRGECATQTPGVSRGQQTNIEDGTQMQKWDTWEDPHAAASTESAGVLPALLFGLSALSSKPGCSVYKQVRKDRVSSTLNYRWAAALSASAAAVHVSIADELTDSTADSFSQRKLYTVQADPSPLLGRSISGKQLQ